MAQEGNTRKTSYQPKSRLRKRNLSNSQTNAKSRMKKKETQQQNRLHVLPSASPEDNRPAPKRMKDEIKEEEKGKSKENNESKGFFLTQDANEEDNDGVSERNSMEDRIIDKTDNVTNNATGDMANDRQPNTDHKVTKDTGAVHKIGPRNKTELNAGLRKEYSQGLDNLRKMITDIECDLDHVALEFYSCTENNDDDYEKYLKNINDKLLMCNNVLRKKQIKLEVIDSEVKFMIMLNKLRELKEDMDHDVTESLTEFYEHHKRNIDKVHNISTKYRNTVLKILQSSCISYHNSQVNLDIPTAYRKEVENYSRDILTTLENIDWLIKSYQSGIKQDLFTNTNFSERVLICCDQKAFPILRIIPDLSEKITYVCRQSRQWVDKDEIYIHDINNYIRQKRNQTRKKKQDLQFKQEKLDSMSFNVEEAYVQFKENKKELHKIEKKLKILETQVSQCSQSMGHKLDERRQKEGMVGFLEISITQTKRNTSLQLKRNRLQRQLRELEESIQQIELELSQVQKELDGTQNRRSEMEEKVDQSNHLYISLKCELDLFNANLGNLQRDMEELSTTLTELEIIHDFKTSPEKVEDFYERPVSVKLAPSLKEKIKNKRRNKLNK